MTAQMHENLVLNGEETSMAFCPPLSENNDLIIQLNNEEAEHSIKDHKFGKMIFSTACWRGYLGTWEIKENRFYLKDIIGRYKINAPGPVLADWFTGVLRIPRGKMLQGIHMGFASVYEKELHIKIDKGIVVKEVEIDNKNNDIDRDQLALGSLPGDENKFEGDDI